MSFAQLCQAYDIALSAWETELRRDLDTAKEQELDDAFSALRDEVFDFRPKSIDEVALKATFLSTRWDDSEGLNAHRIQQLFHSLGAPLIEPQTPHKESAS